MRERPRVFDELPKVKIITVAGQGRKTATRPHRFRAKPEHFTNTRCVFCLAGGRCAPQVAAVEAGLHPWTWKPTACWMHPLRLGDQGRAAVPPPLPENDPDRAQDYPGFSSVTPCGKHDPGGVPWEQALTQELAYFQGARVPERHHPFREPP